MNMSEMNHKKMIGYEDGSYRRLNQFCSRTDSYEYQLNIHSVAGALSIEWKFRMKFVELSISMSEL